jgi:hypothetical protein
LRSLPGPPHRATGQLGDSLAQSWSAVAARCPDLTAHVDGHRWKVPRTIVEVPAALTAGLISGELESVTAAIAFALLAFSSTLLAPSFSSVHASPTIQ